MKKYRWQVSPGSMGAVGLACSLLGVENVEPGSWSGPFYVMATDEDASALTSLLSEAAFGHRFNATRLWSSSN
ncbi:hypothetical protein [Myxococcus phage Mx1]|nr:hypothetical protein [Myxococcus phage Mx1]